jgi:branched-subunit amino acid aminotransferase/4-amino-4-deoxychorismate lyase
MQAEALQLWAVESSGPKLLAARAGAGTVHDLLDELPGGVYSALRTFHHVRFLWLDEHLDRTERSMRALGWRDPLDRARLKSALHELVTAYPLADARVRFDVMPRELELRGARARMFVALSPFVPVPAEFVRDGVHVDFAEHLHRANPRVKTTDFVRERRPLPLGTRERYESLLVDERGFVLECSSANVLFVRGARLLTAQSGVLEGITCKVLLHLAPSLGLEPRDERVHRGALADLDEALLTSSARGVVPIVEVAGAKIGDGRVGPRTRALIDAYAAFAEREARPAIAT